MTWYINEILLPASANAIARITQDAKLRQFAYLIKNLDNYPWYTPEHKHDLPENGLLVLRPVLSLEISDEIDWYNEPILDWTSVRGGSESAANLDQGMEKKLGNYLSRECIPSISFRMFLSSLATEVRSPVMYYDCFMWGGDVECEYSLLYSPNEVLIVTQLEEKNEFVPLTEGLKALGIHMQSGYFAPHTRGFPWETYRI
jgi:hypothetical protein